MKRSYDVQDLKESLRETRDCEACGECCLHLVWIRPDMVHAKCMECGCVRVTPRAEAIEARVRRKNKARLKAGKPVVDPWANAEVAHRRGLEKKRAAREALEKARRWGAAF